MLFNKRLWHLGWYANFDSFVQGLVAFYGFGYHPYKLPNYTDKRRKGKTAKALIELSGKFLIEISAFNNDIRTKNKIIVKRQPARNRQALEKQFYGNQSRTSWNSALSEVQIESRIKNRREQLKMYKRRMRISLSDTRWNSRNARRRSDGGKLNEW